MIVPHVIVGGGIAGAVAAAALARAGRSPLLLERSHGAHHKVCGEFLSWEAADRLHAIGFNLAALGGSAIGRVRVVAGKRVVEAKLPRVATGISRHALDEALLAHAAGCGARIERGVVVRSATTTDGSIEVDADGTVISARTLLLATGKSNLRGQPRDIGAQPVTGDLVGFKMHCRLTRGQTAVLAGTVELHLFGSGGYAGLQLVERGIANLCLLLPKAAMSGGGTWDTVLPAILHKAERLAQRLAGAAMLFERPLAISGVPYGYIHRAGVDVAPRVRRLGDQFAVVHSFTGDGMAIAAASGALAAASGAGFHTELRRRVSRPVRVSSLLHAGLRAPCIRAPALAAAALWPGLLTGAARLTRVTR